MLPAVAQDHSIAPRVRIFPRIENCYQLTVRAPRLFLCQTGRCPLAETPPESQAHIVPKPFVVHLELSDETLLSRRKWRSRSASVVLSQESSALEVRQHRYQPAHGECNCLNSLMKFSRSWPPSPTPAYAIWISCTFFRCGSRENGKGLGAPTAQK